MQDPGAKGETKAAGRPKGSQGVRMAQEVCGLSKYKPPLLSSHDFEAVCLIVSTGFGRSSSLVLICKCFCRGCDLDLLLMGKQKHMGLICLTPRSQQ